MVEEARKGHLISLELELHTVVSSHVLETTALALLSSPISTVPLALDFRKSEGRAAKHLGW